METEAETEKAEIFGQAEIFQSLIKKLPQQVSQGELNCSATNRLRLQDSCCAARAKQGRGDSRFNYMIRS